MTANLQTFFQPTGVAVIGASSNPTKLSHGVVRNLIEHGFQGAIYPVNPKGGDILGLAVYTSITAVPDPIDLAVVMLAAKYVPAVVRECGERGIENVIVVSGGFREAGEDGQKLENELAEVIKEYGIRMIGPNCVGVMDIYLPLDTTFITEMPNKGPIAFVSHSGAICGGTTDWARDTGVGFSRIASLGNQLDVDIADGISIMNADPNTRVINVYAEGLPDGRRFIDAASKVYREKPIVMLKSGLTSAGTRAVASHTGALAGSANAYLAACHKAGVLVVNSLQEQNDVAMVLATQPLPNGNRVALLTNAGGPAALAADELDRAGLTLANLSDEAQVALSQVTPQGTQLANPVDMLGGPSAEMYCDAGNILLADDAVDMLIAMFVPQAITPVLDVARNVINAAKAHNKPVICCLVGGESIPEAMRLLNESGIPCYQDPNRAAIALGGLLRYQTLKNRPDLTPKSITGVNRSAVQKLFAEAWAQQGAGFIDAEVAAQVAAAYGIHTPKSGLACTTADATRLANACGYPVVMKLIASDVVHKADVGGIKLNLRSDEDVSTAFEDMLAAHPGAQVMVQRMIPDGQEVIIGSQRDSQFGQLVMFGMGGAYVEVFKDVAFRLAPFNAVDAETMIMETAAGKIMTGLRGKAPGDMTAVVDTLLRVGQLVADFPCISELDINPLIVAKKGEGAWAVDVRISLDQEPE